MTNFYFPETCPCEGREWHYQKAVIPAKAGIQSSFSGNMGMEPNKVEANSKSRIIKRSYINYGQAYQTDAE
jgi:hypothetical protein